MVDDVQLQGLVGTQADRLADGLLGPFGVSRAQLGEAADVGRGVVDLLERHRVGLGCRGGRTLARLDVLARRPPVRFAVGRAQADLDRRGRAQVGARRHRGDVAGVQDVGAGAGGAGAARRDVRRHRHGRGEDRLDDLAHRRVQPARRVELEHHQTGSVLGGALQAAQEIVGRGRGDRAVDRQHRDPRRARASRQRQQKQQQEQEPHGSPPQSTGYPSAGAITTGRRRSQGDDGSDATIGRPPVVQIARTGLRARRQGDPTWAATIEPGSPTCFASASS